MQTESQVIESTALALPRGIVVEHFHARPASRGITIENDRDRFGFFACLSGASSVSLGGGREPVRIRKGACGTYAEDRGAVSVAEYDESEPFALVSITMPPSVPGELFGVDVDALRPGGNAPGVQRDNCRIRFMPKGCPVDRLFHEIARPPVTDAFRPVYLEGKILETLSIMLNRLCAGREGGRGPRSTTSREAAKIREIREFLLADLSRSPSVIDLARAFGFTHNRLNHCFKELFGTTVYGYLREKRMEKARDMLLIGDHNVTEVCMQVGYTNLSHFAKMYRQKYGHNPGGAKRRLA